MDDYEKAINLLDKPKKKQIKANLVESVGKRKRKRTYAAHITFVITVFFVVVLFYNVVSFYQEKYEEQSIIIEEIKALGYNITGAEITYNQRISTPNSHNWTKVEIKVEFLDTPWESYLADLWFNTETKMYEVVEKEKI